MHYYCINICQNEKYSIQRTDFYDWIKNAESCAIKEFEKCAATYRRWSEYILNAFKYGLTMVLLKDSTIK